MYPYIAHVYKRKGDRASYYNHRSIALRNIAGKILTRIILNRLISYVAENVGSQYFFRAGRGTCDMIFAICQLQKVYMGQWRDTPKNVFLKKL